MSFDLIIVGGGLAGLALASALRDTRLKIALVESNPPQRSWQSDSMDRWDARIYAITPANAEFLTKIGTWKHLDSTRMCPINAMEVYGDQGARLDFSAYDTGVEELGWILESSLMACELWENVKRQSNLTLLTPFTPTALKITEERAELTLNNNQTLTAKLLVGADGRDSWVRNQTGLRAKDTPYEEMGVVANFETEQAHHGIARQWFRTDGVLAWLPLTGNRISIVWSTPNEHAARLQALSPEALATTVAQAGQHALGALKTITPANAFPLRLIRIPRTVAPRIALIGDAAHGIHPLSGHGINLGYQDAQALANLLAQTPDWKDIGDERFLQQYQRERKEETLLLQTGTHALHEMFKGNLPGLAFLRNTGMKLTNHLPFAKELLIRYAIGSL